MTEVDTFFFFLLFVIVSYLFTFSQIDEHLAWALQQEQSGLHANAGSRNESHPVSEPFSNMNFIMMVSVINSFTIHSGKFSFHSVGGLWSLCT